jgi:hypothetical protein
MLPPKAPQCQAKSRQSEKPSKKNVVGGAANRQGAVMPQHWVIAVLRKVV